MNGEKRRHRRFNMRIPVELRVQGSNSAITGETADISLGGFYLPTMFTFKVGTELDITLQTSNATMLAVGRVVTCDPNVGNGVQFLRMLPEDQEELNNFLQSVAPELNPQLRP
jgi:tetrahydromethanopterin S-methyltransferase subunit E